MEKAADTFSERNKNRCIQEKDAKIKSILITSINSDEGKSTLSTALSIAFAQQGRRVLLVDGDVRKPELQHVFNAENKKGLVDMVLYGAELKTVVQKTEIDSMYLISAGANCIHPPSLFRRSGIWRSN